MLITENVYPRVYYFHMGMYSYVCVSKELHNPISRLALSLYTCHPTFNIRLLRLSKYNKK